MQRPGSCGNPGRPALVSIILPVHNAEEWLDECLESVLQQDFEGSMELSVFDDASKDNSVAIIGRWKGKLEGAGIPVVIGGHDSPSPRGGRCDDAAESEAAAPGRPAAPNQYHRVPSEKGSPGLHCPIHTLDQPAGARPTPDTVRSELARAALPTSLCHARWASEEVRRGDSCRQHLLDLTVTRTAVFTSHGPTVIMPTWFCSRAWFSHVGLFDQGGQGVPEDLLFFYEHLRKGGRVVRVDQSLLVYRYHLHAATHSVLEETVWTHRVRFLEEQALPHWATFTIWNAGKQGRRLYRSLTAASRCKVVAFCDVDEKKIKRGFYCHEDTQERPKPRVPILHFRAARPPFVICVKLDLTGGEFEDNLRSLSLREGWDFLHFS